MWGRLFRQTSWQLLTVYLILVTLASFRVFTRYTLHFEIFALIIAIIYAVRKEKTEKKAQLPAWLLIVGILLILATRIAPYWDNGLPLGFDAGFYTAAIEQYSAGDVDEWFAKWSPPGLFTITNFFKATGTSTIALVVYFYILLQMMLGGAIYTFTKTFFNRNAAILAVFFYALSYAQFVVFHALFFKNVLALILMLTAFTLIARKQYILGSIAGIVLCGVHQPTFLLFGLCYLLYTVNISLKNDKKLLFMHTVSGAAILGLGLLYYVTAFKALIADQAAGFTTAVGSGAFMDLFTYEFASLAYLPLALMGFFTLLRKREFGIPFAWWLISAIIVYFRLVFYNRFIVYLDIMMVILAGAALADLLAEHRKTAYAMIALIVLSMGTIIVPAIRDSRHHISPEEYVFITGIPEITEENASIISNMVEDAPLLVAYSKRKIIAPGLFGHGNWTLMQWTRYWTADSFGRIGDLMDQYPGPLYIYLGEKSQRGDTGKFNSTCITRIAQQDRMELLRYDC
ncbi:MAG: hypothetical protein QW165_01115 [Candidatus Woesearchaeota archaeon]